ncbi:MAG TPA: universal stress protein [Ignavibacteria bacterium]|nr:universal stress protein [Ignavibacteria bacterium]
MKILIPTDFSKQADKAIDFAVNISRKSKNTELFLLHTYIPIQTGFLSRDIQKKDEAITRERLEVKLNFITDNLKKKYKGIKLTTNLVSGANPEAITDFANKKRIDLIVMGTKGASGVKEVLIGSVASNVIKSTTKPVIIIPENYHYNGVKKLSFATDYRDEDMNALKQLKNISDAIAASVELVHYSEPELEEALENYKINFYGQKIKSKHKFRNITFKRITGEDFNDTLTKYEKQNKIDMIAMVTYRRKGFLNLIFDKSLTKKIACHTKIPLLVLH